MNHYDEMTCLQYLEGLLERPRALELSAHAEGCAECRTLLRALEGESKLLTSALREQEESVPARLLSPVFREKTPWAWIVSFGMAAAGLYWLWDTIIDPWRAQLSQAGFGETDLLTMMLFRGSLWNGWQTMWTMVQALAVICFGMLGFFLLRRGARRWHTIAVVLVALMSVMLLPTGASAAEIHRGQSTYTLPAGSEVKTDLILIGSMSVHIDGTVDGDVISLLGQSVNVTGHVTGDVIVFGQTLTVNGTVDGNIRAFVQQVTLRGKVAKNVSVWTNALDTDPGSEVGHSMLVFANIITTEGSVGRDIQTFANHLVVNGPVGGDIRATCDMMTIGSSAQIQGATVYKGHHEAEIDSGAKLASPVQFTLETRKPVYNSARYYWHLALSWGAAFVFGLVLILIIPSLFTDAVRNAERFAAAGFGALLMFGTPIVAALVCFTIVGLAVSISTLMLYAMAVYAGKTFIAVWLGQKMFGMTLSTGGLIGRLAAGLVVIYALRQMPYTIGTWVAVLVAIWGLGALALALYQRLLRIQPASAAVAA